MQTLPELALDHLVIAAARLGEGIEFVEERLGARLPLGGKHPIMNTHNAVMRLGDKLYLEVIAIDPEAGPAARPRWFGLDDPKLQTRLAAFGPGLVAWVARSDDLAATLAANTADQGQALRMTRGILEWQIAVRPDGAPPAGGLLPVVIEWPPGIHPTAQRMPDFGVKFAGLTVRAAKPETARAALAGVGAERLAAVKPMRKGAGALEASFLRADGVTAVITSLDTAAGQL